MQKMLLVLLALNMAFTAFALPSDDPYEQMMRDQDLARQEAREERKKYLFPQGERFLPEMEKNTIISLRWFAAAGDLESQVILADLFAKGVVTPQDYKAAYYWYALAGEAGNTYGQYMSGVISQLGLNGEPDAEQAAEWYRAAQKQEDRARAMRRVAQFFEDPNNPSHSQAETFRWYEKAAHAGDTESQLVLGDWYYQGDKIPKNILTAMKWYGKAAANHSPYAEYSLGIIYLTGSDAVPMNYGHAMEWLQKAAFQNFHAAQYLLGKMYYSGTGVVQNNVVAFAWWKLSNALDNEEVSEDLARLTQKMSTDELQQATKLYHLYQEEMGA
jgi:TPR repeat protein